MKKISLIAMLSLIVVMIASCGGAASSSYETALDVINTVWSNVDEADKFPVGGGDSANLNMEGPGKFDHTNKDELDVTLALPGALADQIDDAASMVHMMNANQLTAAAYRLVEGADAAAFAKDYKANLDGRRWMCGFPEKFVVVQSGNYVVTAFGNGMNIDNFKVAAEKLENATVLLEGAIEA
jgi:hypothetical protein